MWNIFSWLFSVVIVSFLVNVASAYAMPHIDKFLGRFSDYQRVRSAKKRAQIDKAVNKMLEDHDYFLYRLSQKNANLLRLYINIGMVLFFLVAPSLRIGVISYLKEVEANIDITSYPQALIKIFFDFRNNVSTTIFVDFVFLQLTILFFMSSSFFAFIHTVTSTTIINEYFKRKAILKYTTTYLQNKSK